MLGSGSVLNHLARLARVCLSELRAVGEVASSGKLEGLRFVP